MRAGRRVRLSIRCSPSSSCAGVGAAFWRAAASCSSSTRRGTAVARSPAQCDDCEGKSLLPRPGHAQSCRSTAAGNSIPSSGHASAYTARGARVGAGCLATAVTLLPPARASDRAVTGSGASETVRTRNPTGARVPKITRRLKSGLRSAVASESDVLPHTSGLPLHETVSAKLSFIVPLQHCRFLASP